MEGMPRKLQTLGQGAPTVESSLDEFITRATNESVETVDTSDFDPKKSAERELALKNEVDQLTKRLELLKAKRRPSQGWGKLVIGFVLGCGAMFAVSALMPRETAAPPPTTAATPAPAVTPAPVVTPAPAPHIAVTPIEEAPVPAAAPTPPPVETQPAPVVSAPAAKPAKKPHRSTPEPAHAETPPADTKAGSGLYNPF
jgi:hypothetical protein